MPDDDDRGSVDVDEDGKIVYVPKSERGKKTPPKTVTVDEALADVERQGAKVKKKARTEGRKAAASQALEAGGAEFDPLSILGVIPAALSTVALASPLGKATGADEYLVGNTQTGDARPLKDLSIGERILSPNQLSFGDVYKSIVHDTDAQRDILEGTASGWTEASFKLLEGAGLATDLATDPLNWLGGAGLVDDAFKGLEAGVRIIKPLEFLSKKAATEGADGYATKAIDLFGKHNRTIDDIDAGLAAGVFDEATAITNRQAVGAATRKAYSAMNGEALYGGYTTLQKARYVPTGPKTHEAPTSAKGRAGLGTERLQQISADLGRYLGVNPAEAFDAAKLDVFDGRINRDVVTDLWARGYPSLSAEAREVLGITGKLWRGNPADVFGGRALNPFSRTASRTLPVREAAATYGTPFSFLRRASIGDVDRWGAKTAGNILNPGLGRSGGLWKSAFMMTSDGPAKRAARARFAKIMGRDLDQMTAEQWAMYPLTLFNTARLDGVVRAGGRALRRGALESSHELAVRMSQDFDVNPEDWLVAGTRDLRPVSHWTNRDSAALDAAEAGVGGKRLTNIHEALSKAVHDSLTRGDVSAVVGDVGRPLLRDGEPVVDAVERLGRDMINDPEFGKAMLKIANDPRWATRIAERGLTPGHLVRAALEAVSTVTSIARQADHLDWREALTRETTAVHMFSPTGAEIIGREAKLLALMEDLGLAVVNRNMPDVMTTEEFHDLIRTTTARYTGELRTNAAAIDELLEVKRTFVRGLRAREVTEDRIAKIEAQLADDAFNKETLAGLLDEGLEAADIARLGLDDATGTFREQRGWLRGIERAADDLERVHLGILRYQELDEILQQKMTELDAVTRHVSQANVGTQPLREVLESLLLKDFDIPVRTTGATGAGGAGTKGSVLLNMFMGDTPEAAKAGATLQQANRLLSFGRDLFGEEIKLRELIPHSPTTEAFIGRKVPTGMTEGAFNFATIANVFASKADHRLQAYVDSIGGWLAVFGRQDLDEMAGIANFAKRISRDDAALSNIGIPEEEVARFTFGTLAQTTDAIRPFVNKTIEYIETGQGAEDLGRMFVGDREGAAMSGQEALQNFLNGDLTWLDTLIRSAVRSFDVAIDISGGFADYDKFQMLRRVVQKDPALRGSFEWLLDTLNVLDSLPAYLGHISEAGNAQRAVLSEVERIVAESPDIVRLLNRRDPLVDTLISNDLAAIGRGVAISEEEMVAARAVLTGTLAGVRQTRRNLDVIARRTGRLGPAHQEQMSLLSNQEGMLENLMRAVDARDAGQIAAAVNVSRAMSATRQTPIVHQILNGSADFRVVQRGQADFLADPANRFYMNAKGVAVERTDDQLLAMWGRRMEKAADWTEKLAERAVNGWTRGGQTTGKVTRYTETDRIAKEWLEEKSFEGFGVTWRGAALTGGGFPGEPTADLSSSAAQAMVSIAMTEPALISSNPVVAAFDILTAMLKGQFVATGSFSPRNLQGGLIENVRQGVNVLVTKKVWTVDRQLRLLEQVSSYANSLPEGEARTAIYDLVARVQGKVTQKHGKDVVGAVIDARKSGVAQPSFFRDVAGGAVEEERGGYIRSIQDAWATGRYGVESRFGQGPLVGFGGFASAVRQVPTYPAAKFEHGLAKATERMAAGRDFSRLGLNSDDLDKLRGLLDDSEDFGIAPSVEALLRIDLFAQRRLAGDPIARAFDRVMESHFDYSDLSDVDIWMRRLMPFWIWRSRSLAHYGEMIAHRPAMAKSTYGIWNERRRGEDDRAPLYAQKSGGGFDANMELALAVPDPANDLIDLFESISKDITTDEPGAIPLALGGNLIDVLRSTAQDDFNPLAEIPTGIIAESDLRGVPIDIPTTVQGPMDLISSSGSGGEKFVETFAHRGKNGKWYWNYPGASYLFGEMMPMVSQVTKITGPGTEGEDAAQKTLGAITRFFGLPIRSVPTTEQERNQTAAEIRRKFDEAEERRDQEVR